MNGKNVRGSPHLNLHPPITSDPPINHVRVLSSPAPPAASVLAPCRPRRPAPRPCRALLRSRLAPHPGAADFGAQPARGSRLLSPTRIVTGARSGGITPRAGRRCWTTVRYSGEPRPIWRGPAVRSSSAVLDTLRRGNAYSRVGTIPSKCLIRFGATRFAMQNLSAMPDFGATSYAIDFVTATLDSHLSALPKSVPDHSLWMRGPSLQI
eukprot:scaffold3368_cov107-Isochrysis_galbana.AAC.7